MYKQSSNPLEFYDSFLFTFVENIYNIYLQYL